MPTCFGIAYKGEDEIRERRDVKIRAVNLICAAANRYPMTASRGNALPNFDPNDEWRVDPVAEAVLLGLQAIAKEPNARSILTTAKGCASKPKDVLGDYQQQNFYEFCLAAGQAICAGSYLEAAWGWAVQIIEKNSNSFPRGSLVFNTKATVDTAEAAWRARFV